VCFDFLYKPVSNILYSEKKWARYYHKRTQVFMWSTRYSCQILTKLEFSWQICGKSPNIKFHENPSVGSRVVPCGQADRHDEADSRFFAISLIRLKMCEWQTFGIYCRLERSCYKTSVIKVKRLFWLWLLKPGFSAIRGLKPNCRSSLADKNLSDYFKVPIII